MRARVPLDVDLEDKLLYGLTPIRLAYMVLTVLGAIALWSSPGAPQPVRAVASAAIVAAGAALSWGRWRARPADCWLADIAIFAVGNHRVAWDVRWRARMRPRPAPEKPRMLRGSAEVGEAVPASS
jgi:hypothetical protein